MTSTIIHTAQTTSLVDNHAHTLFAHDAGRSDWLSAMFLTDDDAAWPDGGASPREDSQLGFAIAKWCAPRLSTVINGAGEAVETDPTDPLEYWRLREQAVRVAGREAVDQVLLRGRGAAAWVVDHGFATDRLVPPERFASLAGGKIARSVRLEPLAEQALAITASLTAGPGNGPAGTDAASTFLGRFRALLNEAVAATHAVALKTVAAYRTGFDIDWRKPSPGLLAAAVRNLDAKGRRHLVNPIIESAIIDAALDAGLPLQFHVGVGDAEVDLHATDPTLLDPLIRRANAAGVPIVLLHCAPWERQAGYLSSIHPLVFADVSLAVTRSGAQAREVLSRALSWTPFNRLLYASDGVGVAETHALGSVLFRKALGELIDEWVRDGDWTQAQGVRVIEQIAHGNARRLYGLEAA